MQAMPEDCIKADFRKEYSFMSTLFTSKSIGSVTSSIEDPKSCCVDSYRIYCPVAWSDFSFSSSKQVEHHLPWWNLRKEKLGSGVSRC